MSRLYYFAWVRDMLGKSEDRVDIADGGERLGDLLDRLTERGPAYADVLKDRRRLRFAVNQNYASEDDTVSSGDEIAIFPPVTGG